MEQARQSACSFICSPIFMPSDLFHPVGTAHRATSVSQPWLLAPYPRRPAPPVNQLLTSISHLGGQKSFVRHRSAGNPVSATLADCLLDQFTFFLKAAILFFLVCVLM
jgi:hypothetical protein